MGIAQLQARIKDKSARLGVIGLGYVGLAGGMRVAEAGMSRLWVLISIRTGSTRFPQGFPPIEGDEPGLAKLLTRVVAERRLSATTDYAELCRCDVVTISVDAGKASAQASLPGTGERAAGAWACDEGRRASDCGVNAGAGNHGLVGPAHARSQFRKAVG